MSSRDSSDMIGVILNIHAMINGFLGDAVEEIPESRIVDQPGTIVNHPAWTLSHLNAYSGLLLSMLDDPSVPTVDAEMERYGYGTTPVNDPAAYATKQQLLDRFRARNARVAVVVADKHSDYFPRPAPPQFQPHAATIAHIATTLLVAHPGHHIGQLNQWRRAAGLAPR
jgi:hypothetical protein